MSILKKLAPIAGGAIGYLIGGPAGSAALNAALGSGIGTLLAGGDTDDVIKNAILAGGAGAGLGALGIGTGATGVAAQSAGAKAATQAAAAKAAEATAAKAAASEAAKGGLFGTGISAGDIVIGSNLLGLLGKSEEEDITGQPGGGESSPDYEGKPYKGLFIDPDTGIAYDTIEELEDAVKARMTLASGGIVTLQAGGLIEGPGTGTSDDIKAGIYQNGKKVQEARLSDEEFVMTKKAVTGAGNGDPKKGADVMYSLMDKFERMA